MDRGETLEAVLAEDGAGGAVARAVLAMARAAADFSVVIAAPALEGRLGGAAGSTNADGDAQRTLDLVAEDRFSAALREAGIAGYLSEEVEAPVVFDPKGEVAVAIDPLDGSSNIDVNAPIGTIFSIWPAVASSDAFASFRRTGRDQLAAGYFAYGPQTSLLLTTGRGTRQFTLDRGSGAFLLVEPALAIPRAAAEYAINASNARRWREPVRAYVEDCLAGKDGPRGKAFNMRWAASLVSDATRVLTRGGVFLYPGDDRKGYEEGRLRLLYEAAPVAWLAEQAGGAATDGLNPLLDIAATSPHQRTPLVFGSVEEVEEVARRHREAAAR